MGGGLAQVGILAVLTVIVLPCCLFTLLSLLDRFERSLGSDETGRAAAHDLERFLTTLGTIATISPLLGLLGTVIGMIEIFGSQTPSGGNPIVLAHGISIALYNTAMGLIVAIPSMIFYRYYRGKVDSLIVEMESQAVKLVEILHGERQN